MMGAPTTHNNATSQLRAHPSGASQEEWPTATRSIESQATTRREGTRAGQCAGETARRARSYAEIIQQLARPLAVPQADTPRRAGIKWRHCNPHSGADCNAYCMDRGRGNSLRPGGCTMTRDC